MTDDQFELRPRTNPDRKPLIAIEHDVHRRLKELSAHYGVPIYQIATQMLEQCLSSFCPPPVTPVWKRLR